MPLVVIDASHGGHNLGAAYGGRLEKDDARVLALAVGRILEDSNVRVYYTRTEVICKPKEVTS